MAIHHGRITNLLRSLGFVMVRSREPAHFGASCEGLCDRIGLLRVYVGVKFSKYGPQVNAILLYSCVIKVKQNGGAA